MKTILFLLLSLSGLQAYAWGQCHIIGTPETLNKPVSNSALKSCHVSLQNKMTAQGAGFRSCREKFGNTGEPLHLTLSINLEFKLVGDFNKKSTPSSAVALSECFVRQMEKVKVDDKACDCAYDYVWDGSFPLNPAKAKAAGATTDSANAR